MSMNLMVKALETKVGNPLRKLVLIKLADNASDIGECWPSYQHIADQCEIDRSTVRKHIKQLEAQGLLRIENREGPKGNSTNLYFLNLWAVGQKSTPVGQESTGVGPQPTGGVGPESTRTSHSSEPVNEPKSMGTDSMEGFDQFWKLYPKKKSRKDALKAWAKLKPNDELRQTLITALGRHCISEDWAKDGGRYIPNAATWLNGERWHDELAPATGKISTFTNLPQHEPNAYPEVPHGQTNF
ncbi:helix-turn-helix domain-containing protein [Pseudomonas aphyarum]|uniref:Helix-turn-helix domain-containing protein n=1 Tax=Pseudomonas aphyarum TaxID=2942629 RepID=A0ABT5PVL4_9PSED|nr:helix-turn-helix domain-containing protein [Pseudomonas aphyarum]MDD0969705.1 helix-turn-helix domain-containing protein [Pseudomonas aphyarum]MDD1127785.1 helix-turn-helix domain-containing protein [Pseudomonas aphyarum]